APIYAVYRDGTEPKNLAEDDDFALLDGSDAEMAPTTITRRTAILGFMPGNRNALLVEARGRPTFPPEEPIPTTLFSINLSTGKLTTLSEDLHDGRYFYDQKGNARLIYTHPRLSHTRPFLYHT